MARPSVFDFNRHTDYFVALQKSFTSRGNKISLASWVKRLGYSSPRTIGMILKGQRFPTEDFLFRLAQDLKLSEAESRYLDLLVLKARFAAKRRSTEQIDAEIERCNPNRKVSRRVIEENVFRYVSSWHHFVIYFLALRPDFREEATWIRSHIRFKLADWQVTESLECLLNLRLLRRNAKTGRIEPALDGSPATTEDIPSEAIKRFHHSSLNKAVEALQTQDVKEREYSSIMITMDPQRLPEARAMLREFRDKFNRKFYEEGRGAVYQLNLNLFSYSKNK